MLAHVYDAEIEIGGANVLRKIGPEISAPVWTGKELAGFAGDPVGQETHPFARRRIEFLHSQDPKRDLAPLWQNGLLYHRLQ
jgi:hypothetical protein